MPGARARLELGAHRGLLRPVFVADEHPALLGADREHPRQHPLDHQVRLLGQDLAVLERAGLGLVGVADDVLGLGPLAGDHLPLGARGESGAPHSPQPRFPERPDRVLEHPAHAHQSGFLDHLDRLVTAQLSGDQPAHQRVARQIGSAAYGSFGHDRGGVFARAGGSSPSSACCTASRNLGGPHRPLLDGRGRGDVAPPDARNLADLDLDAVAVALVDLQRSARPRRAASTTGRGTP